jgi:hypothetical protein
MTYVNINTYSKNIPMTSNNKMLGDESLQVWLRGSCGLNTWEHVTSSRGGLFLFQHPPSQLGAWNPECHVWVPSYCPHSLIPLLRIKSQLLWRVDLQYSTKAWCSPWDLLP